METVGSVFWWSTGHPGDKAYTEAQSQCPQQNPGCSGELGSGGALDRLWPLTKVLMWQGLETSLALEWVLASWLWLPKIVLIALGLLPSAFLNSRHSML